MSKLTENDREIIQSVLTSKNARAIAKIALAMTTKKVKTCLFCSTTIKNANDFCNRECKKSFYQLNGLNLGTMYSTKPIVFQVQEQTYQDGYKKLKQIYFDINCVIEGILANWKQYSETTKKEIELLCSNHYALSNHKSYNQILVNSRRIREKGVEKILRVYNNTFLKKLEFVKDLTKLVGHSKHKEYQEISTLYKKE